MRYIGWICSRNEFVCGRYRQPCKIGPALFFVHQISYEIRKYEKNVCEQFQKYEITLLSPSSSTHQNFNERSLLSIYGVWRGYLIIYAILFKYVCLRGRS